MKTLDLLRENREAILEIALYHGAQEVRVFGSVARGEDDENSDLDLLVSIAPDRNLYDLIGLQQDIEQLIGRKTNIITDKSINRYLQDAILQEAVAL